jgi:hypothetical protein
MAKSRGHPRVSHAAVPLYPVESGGAKSGGLVGDVRRYLAHLIVDKTIRRETLVVAGTIISPEKVVTRPPASRTSKTPAAVSHECSPNSQKPSKRPQATAARSMAAEPSRRTPCERNVKSQ